MTAFKVPPQLQGALDRVTASNEFYPVSIPASEGERLRELVIAERARATIEIGLGYGVSALYILAGQAALGEGGHLVLDPHQATRFENRGVRLLEDAGVADSFELRREPSEYALPQLLAEGRQFDLAFVDGNHRFDWVFVDMVFLGRLVKPAGIVFVDDFQLPSIAKSVAFFSANLGWSLEQTSIDDPQHGWAVLRTAPEPVERHFSHFVDF